MKILILSPVYYYSIFQSFGLSGFEIFTVIMLF